ncbi:MAG: hypothetical protein JWL73_102 [Actinomycetia bacterium]|nr:hypothetical protein [Actinomycetes bacterium]
MSTASLVPPAPPTDSVPPTASVRPTDVVWPTRPPVGRKHGAFDLALLALVALGGFLRLWQLGTSRLGYDEAFTAMAGRMPFGSLMSYLTNQDSHPPLDYLIHAPFARAGVDEFFFRLPSALFSIAALALFAWWMRPRGRVGVIATALFAISTFEIVHGRTARMYAEVELLGVGIAMLADAWLRRPRRWHAPLLALLMLLGLLTHVSFFLVGAGLFVLPGRRTDHEAWKWRGAIVIGGLGWAALWGPQFLVQTRGGHSSWIPRTTVSTFVTTLGQLVTPNSGLHLLALVAVVAGGFLISRSDRRFRRLWTCGFVVPIGLAAFFGLFAPVLIDRTLTAFVWAPLFAVALVLDAGIRRFRLLGPVALACVLLVGMQGSLDAVSQRTGPNTALNRLEAVARPGDVVAVAPKAKSVEIQWALGVRSDDGPWQPVQLAGMPKAHAIALTGAPSTGRVWLLDFHGKGKRLVKPADQCAPVWQHGSTRVECLGARSATAQTVRIGSPRPAAPLPAAS